MALSLCGARMANVSGLRNIMEDIATTTADTSGDGWLNLSIGNPAPIPEVIAMWRRLMAETVDGSFTAASCQYGPSRGSETLLDAIVGYFNRKYGWGITTDNVAVGPGSQMLCFVAAALFAGPSAGGMKQIVLPSVPDYTGYQGLCLHPGGIDGIAPRVDFEDSRYFRYSFDFEALERHPEIGVILLSSPSNPTGRCVERHEMDELVRIAERRDVPLLIDNAYGAPFPQIVETQTTPPWHGHVINFFTMSKAGMPGERIGFAIGPVDHINAIVSFIANSALHAPQLSQVVLARALESGELDGITMSVVQPYYLNKRRLAEKLLSDILPESVNWRLHSSRGGMFCWLWIDHSWFDDTALYQLLKRKRVFIVPGRHFFVSPESDPAIGAHGKRCVRISLSTDESVICEGIERLAEGLEELRRAH